MKTYTFEFEYMVPEFATVTVEVKDPGYVQPINEVKELAMAEFTRMYPEAVDPEIISWANV